ncbi:MAG: PleD family two-component system response regulator [Rhodothermales bacterium]
MTSKKTQEALHTLHRLYVEKLPQEAGALEGLWLQAVNDAFFDQGALRDMHLVAHSMSGSGATYGLAHVSEAFARLEEILQEISDQGEEPTPEQKEYVEALLEELKETALAEVNRLETSDANARLPSGKEDRPAVSRRPAHPLVLIVDDTEAVRRRLHIGFEAGGFRVIEAEDGRQALEHARTHKPDLIMLDVRMPQMDGFEAQRRLREEEALKDIPILFLTSTRTVNLDEIQTALSYGVEGYISKTTPLAQIVEKARAALPVW